MTKFMNYTLNKMLFETCGEVPDVIENAKITEIAPNHFHITYKPSDPWNGIDLKVLIEIIEDDPYRQHRYIAHYSISDSVYGEDGDFTIEL